MTRNFIADFFHWVQAIGSGIVIYHTFGGMHYKMNGKWQSLTWTSVLNRLKLVMKDIKQPLFTL